ncbi:MAG: ACT domain-containing protein [Nitrospinaceae bacterium]|jgi:glycine cleavage system transcriptional repressor|nr:ACT domain-containing protein [Nitrospinaceae bacterium]|tara:strand:- start:439 stop:963 length:525 start_codon:yes stop_codon:yes gene_type:complete
MKNWYMLTFIGKDRPGIVSQVTLALYEGGGNLGEASMVRLGGNFSIMLMVHYEGSADSLEKKMSKVCTVLELQVHVDKIEGELHRHVEPDVRISIYGADRAGIVAETTGVLTEAGLNILNLESDVGGSSDNPIYIMEMEGVAGKGIDSLKSALDKLAEEKHVETRISPINTLMG